MRSSPFVNRFAFWRHNRIVKKANPPAAVDVLKEPTDDEFDSVISDYRAKCGKGGYRLILEAVDTKPKAL